MGNKEYYLANRERILQEAKERYAADPQLRERNKVNWKRWAEKNPERLNSHQKKYRTNNKVAIDQRARERSTRIKKARPLSGPKVSKRVQKDTKELRDLLPESQRPKITSTTTEVPSRIEFSGPVIIDQSFWI